MGRGARGGGAKDAHPSVRYAIQDSLSALLVVENLRRAKRAEGRGCALR